MIVSKAPNRTARRRSGGRLVEGHPGQYSTYYHAIEAEPQQSSTLTAHTQPAQLLILTANTMPTEHAPLIVQPLYNLSTNPGRGVNA